MTSANTPNADDTPSATTNTHTAASSRATPRPTLTNPRIVWFHARLPQTISLAEQLEWHEALRIYLRSLGLVVYQEAGFGVVIPIGRDVLATDIHEIANFAIDFGEGMTIDICAPQPVENLLDCCEVLLRRSRNVETAEEAASLPELGLQMVLLVVTRALLEWRGEIDTLQRVH